ncbi:MAG TPA: DNA mismatch repair protein MutS [Pyrinomonadaceae bacterium]|nr:DNA mismatch repair protein MutS [Pyrinomonadaceae bacterium]
MTTATPIRQQYLEIKRRHADAILLFRIGDFYEAFDDDARLLARELDIVLTSKPMGRGLRVPLAGVPHHSLERHLATLIGRGHRVAICEQLTTQPVKGGAGRGLIERDVVRVVTPGTVLEPGLLQSKVNNYLAAYCTDGRRAGIAYADVTTGDFAATELDARSAQEELQRIGPAELLVPAGLAAQFSHASAAGAQPGFVTARPDAVFEPAAVRRTLSRHFGSRSLAPFGLSRWPLAAGAAAAVVEYLNETQAAVAGQLTRLSSYSAEAFMVMDDQTVRALEVFEGRGGAPSLLATLDHTRTAMGGRLLRRWLRQPSLDVAEITRRQEHVAWLAANARDRAELFAALESVHDLERLSGRARAGLALPSEVLAVRQSLETLPRVRAVLGRDGRRFGPLLAALPACEHVLELIRSSVNEEPTGRDGAGLVREGFSSELDELRGLLKNGRTFLAELEQRERARTGIKSLRVGFNKVFGYFIEVTKPNLHLVPEGYARKQTLTSAERFVTLELKEYESLVLNAQERVVELERGIFRRVCQEIGRSRPDLLAAAATVAHLDAVAAFAEAADRRGYTRPRVIDEAVLRVKGGRHPVVETLLGDGLAFVPNDLELGGEGSPEIALVTGPNMSGKSTYLRQAALIVLMAQAGSFVPANSAVVGVTDRVYTRIGLYDRIGGGESTFMTEMVETAHILHHATPRSLVLLDELGRGTSTYDGLAVARAVLEYLHNHPSLRPKTLFATHYFELTALAAVLPRVRNLRVEIAEEGGELRFLYRVSPGVAERSYGVYAAKLAGLPAPVVRRAEELLGEYESGGAPKAGADEAEFEGEFDRTVWGRGARVVQDLLALDVNSLSPVEALMKLYELRKAAEGEEGEGRRVLKSA